jgi:hypothetical protein
MTSAQPSETETGFGSTYAEFAKTLRTWFVAYGIGAPVLILSQEKLANRVTASGAGKFLATLFLLGVGVQVLEAMLFKVAMWYLYLAQMKPALRTSRPFKASEYLSEAMWLELLLDGATILLFGWATTKLLFIVSG